jgi:hypothetical protein
VLNQLCNTCDKFILISSASLHHGKHIKSSLGNCF